MKKITLTLFWIFILAVILAVSTNAQLADSPWPMFRGNLLHTGWSPYDTSHVDGTVKCTFETGAGIESSPAIGSDGTIYVGSHDSKLYAINPDGTEKWRFDAGEPIYDKKYDIWKGIASSPAIASDGTIYITSLNNFLFAINPDGAEKWRFSIKVESDTWTSPAIGPDGTIYIGSSRHNGGIGGKLYAINPDGKEKWHFQAESDIFPSPVIGDDGTIYFGSGANGKFWAVNPDGTLKWYFQTGKHVESSAAIGEDGTIYFGSWDNYFYALTPYGTEKWKFKTLGEGIVSSPAVGRDGAIYLAADDGNLYAFNPTGTKKWQFKLGESAETGSSPAIGSDGTIYVGFSDGTFYAINPDGTEKWRFTGSPGSGIISSPAIGSDGTIYVGSWNKHLYAFDGPSTAKKNETKSRETSALKTENQIITENTSCGNNICEPPAESPETCWDDCCLTPGCGKPKADFKNESIPENRTALVQENKVILNETILIKEDKTILKEKREWGFFEKIIDFFRMWFK